ncbi:MAG TPA: PQQ-binding-like beta-propeller repeat protein, partial [Candidatus Nitrosotalea sp.]|nr:PQQ-binding-like beta-propeller repeat protein [Candidatus Nitrosotalea sp.]
GPDLNGVSQETNWSSLWPKEGPKQVWKTRVGTGFSSVAVSHGRIYTMGNDGNQDTVFCLDANAGTPIWKHSYPTPMDPKWYEGGPSATPAVDGDRVFTLSKRGLLLCLGAADGSVIWSKDLVADLGVKIPTWGFAGSPVVEGNLLIVNAGSAGTAFDKSTGKVVWTSGKNAAGYASPVPVGDNNGRTAVLFLADSVAAVNLNDGKEIWRHPWTTKYDVNAADPIVIGDRVFISSGYDRGCALLRIGGKSASVLWENKEMRNHFNSCVLVHGYLFGFDESELKCVDLNSGVVKWTENRLGKGSLMAAGDRLVILGEKGELVVAVASSGGFKPLARAQVLGGRCWSTPVLSNARIYCRNATGDLVCLDVSGS